MTSVPSSLNRRGALAAAAAATLFRPAQAAGGRIEAVGFDAFTVFDPRSLTLAVEEAFPGRGAELTAAWRTRQFDYCWQSSLSRRYVDFWRITGAALDYTAAAANIELSAALRARLMDANLRLALWPDAVAALKTMAAAGLRLAFAANWTAAMLQANSRNAGLGDLFERMLSTDLVGAYKPDPRAYRMIGETLGLPRERILFAAFAGWDAAGARSFGLQTFWVNRLGAPPERLGPAPDATAAGLAELAHYLTAAPRGDCNR